MYLICFGCSAAGRELRSGKLGILSKNFARTITAGMALVVSASLSPAFMATAEPGGDVGTFSDPIKCTIGEIDQSSGMHYGGRAVENSLSRKPTSSGKFIRATIEVKCNEPVNVSLQWIILGQSPSDRRTGGFMLPVRPLNGAAGCDTVNQCHGEYVIPWQEVSQLQGEWSISGNATAHPTDVWFPGTPLQSFHIKTSVQKLF